MCKLKITPHEPGQPLVGLKETLEDVATFQRLLDEKRERVRKAKQKLREMGMTVLDEEYQIPSDYVARNLNEGDLVEVKNLNAIQLGGIWKDIKITDEDIKEGREELLKKLEERW